MRDYWCIIQDENMSQALQLIGINLTAINNNLDTQISTDQLVKWEEIGQDEELLDQLMQYDPKIEKRIKLIQHVKRAKYWRF